MLDAVGVASLDALIDEAIPASIRLRGPLDLPPAESEPSTSAARAASPRRTRCGAAYIGLGYYDTSRRA
jgi:glycine dehydrogenase